MGKGNIRIRLLDVLGKPVFDEEYSPENKTLNQEINLAEFPRGLYIVHIEGSNQVIRGKITLQNK